MLFSDRSIQTMVHGVGLGGAVLLGLGAVLFYLVTTREGPEDLGRPGVPAWAWLTAVTAVLLWLTVLTGTYIVFPQYRAAPPAGATDLSAYPRALLTANLSTAWLHAFAMEIKEHMPWMAAMLTTAAAFVAVRYRSMVVGDLTLRRMVVALVAVSFVLVALVSVLGVFVNKVAPLD